MSDEKPDDERPIPYTLTTDNLRKIADDPDASERARDRAHGLLAPPRCKAQPSLPRPRSKRTEPDHA